MSLAFGIGDFGADAGSASSAASIECAQLTQVMPVMLMVVRMDASSRMLATALATAARIAAVQGRDQYPAP
jgi:4-alpha-glucanotransferase